MVSRPKLPTFPLCYVVRQGALTLASLNSDQQWGVWGFGGAFVRARSRLEWVFTVIEDSDSNPPSSDSLLPSSFHIHVEIFTSIQVPHPVPVRIVQPDRSENVIHIIKL